MGAVAQEMLNWDVGAVNLRANLEEKQTEFLLSKVNLPR